MRYPLSPQNRESGRVSSLRSTWEGKSPVNKSRRTVLPSEVRSKEKSRAKQSWRSSSAGGQENSSSVPAWRATSDKRTPVKQQQQQSWKSSSSNHRVSTSLSPVPGPRLNSPGRIASPGSASKALSARTNDFIRKWQTIGSTEADASAHDVYGSSPKETIGSSVPNTEVYRSQNEPNSPAARSHNEPDSPATLDMTYSVDDSIPPIKMSDTADSPSMNQLRNVLKSTPNDEKKYQTSNDEKKNQVVQEEQKMQVEEDDEDDEESLYNVDQSVASRSIASRSNASSSLVYSLEDTIPSVAHSRKSKESLKSVKERLKETASSASQISHDGTESESRCSSGLNAVDLVASTLAECRLLLQMSPPPTPLTVNVFKEPRKEEEAEDEDSDRAIQEAPSADDSEASDDSLSKLLRCPCCSHKFEEAGEHEPLHSFACEHIICRECVFDSKRSKSVPCPECGEEGAFNKSKPLVSKSYLRLIKKMGDSASVKSKKTNNERFKDSPMSVPSQINFGSHGKNSNDEISVFSSVSGQIHTAKLANRYRELAKQIDVDNVSVLSMSKPSRPPSVKSSFTINPKQDDVLSQMSESHCIPAGYSKPMHSDNSTVQQEAESVMSHSRSNTSSNASFSVKSDYSQGQVDDLKETSTMPPQEPSTPVSRAEFKFLQRKQRLAESLEKVNKVLAKTKNKSMGRICEEASVASSRISAEESSLASVASSRAVSVTSSRVANSVAPMKQSETPLPVQDEDMTQSTADSSAAASATSLRSKEQQERNANARENKNRFKNQLRIDTGEDKNRFKDQLRVDTGHQPSPLLVHNVQPSPEPICSAQPIKEDTQAEKCSPCESAKSKDTVVSDFNPFGDDPFADNAFGGDNVFRADDVPVVGFGNFIQEPTSSSDTEHEGAFLLPQEKDTKYKEQTQAAQNDLQQLPDVNQCAQFLPALNVSKNGFIDMDDSPSARNGKNMKKRVKKKQQQYASAKPQKFTQKVFKPFGRSFEEASNTSGLNNTNSGANQDWRFQETLPKPPSIESSDDDETQNAPLYEFSEGSCSHSPTDFVDIKSSLDTLVTHKKGLRGKIRDKMKKVGNKRFEL